jgi:hypothetical protein
LQRVRLQGGGGKAGPAVLDDQDYQLGGSLEQTHSGRGYGSNPDLIPQHNCE